MVDPKNRLENTLLLINLKPISYLHTLYSLMHSTYLDNNEIFFIVYPPCIGQCVPQFNETFIELRYALVNAYLNSMKFLLN